MLTMTQSAGARLARKLAKKRAEENVALRFVRDATRGGWLLRLDRIQPTDVKLSHDGRTVVLLDEQVSNSLRNKRLDVKETDEGPRLKFC